jgi:hypothetical protein
MTEAAPSSVPLIKRLLEMCVNCRLDVLMELAAGSAADRLALDRAMGRASFEALHPWGPVPWPGFALAPGEHEHEHPALLPPSADPF